jgi:hypothetical protein
MPFDHNDRYHWLLADITTMELPEGRYDDISRRSPPSPPWARRWRPVASWWSSGATGNTPRADYAVVLLAAPVRPAVMTLRQVRREAAALLPGCFVRRLLFWRYLMVFRGGERRSAP